MINLTTPALGSVFLPVNLGSGGSLHSTNAHIHHAQTNQAKFNEYNSHIQIHPCTHLQKNTHLTKVCFCRYKHKAYTWKIYSYVLLLHSEISCWQFLYLMISFKEIHFFFLLFFIKHLTRKALLYCMTYSSNSLCLGRRKCLT